MAWPPSRPRRSRPSLVQALRWGAGVLEAWLLQGERNDSALTIERLMYVVNSVARALKEGRRTWR